MATRPTGNELFDIFWKEYPARINGVGVMEKKKKGPALKWFEKHKPSEEEVYDMLEWLKKDKACRGKSEDARKFYPARADAIVFLNQKTWIMDEIGIVITDTQRREAHRSKAIQENNLKEYKRSYEGWLRESLVGVIKGHKVFMGLCRSNEQLRDWALEIRPDLKGAKAERPKPVKKLGAPLSQPKKAVATPNAALLQPVPVVADLPPPKRTTKQLVHEAFEYGRRKHPLLMKNKSLF